MIALRKTHRYVCSTCHASLVVRPCPTCVARGILSIDALAYYTANREKVAAGQRAYREANREKITAVRPAEKARAGG